MNDVHAAAYALAALELLPGEPSDLAAVLADPVLRAALLAGDCGADCGTLVGYLTASIDRGRVESWEKRLDRLLSDSAGQPVLAGDQGYPALLAGCWDRPPVLFLRGHFAPDRAALAIVGSRDTKRQTLEAARGVAAAAAYAGMSIVSGLAAGVDTAAHCGALDAGGHTLAVLGTGIRQVFPQQNKALAEQIAQSGALLSQFAPDAPRTTTTFLRRNSVIAGLAAVSLVMDGQERSGSRHEAEQAIRYGRAVLLWKTSLGHQPWAQAMVQAGSASFVASAAEVLAAAEAHAPPKRGLSL